MTRRKTPRPFDLREAQEMLATEKRRRGATYRAIADFVGVSTTTAHRWTKDIAFSPPAQLTRTQLVRAKDGCGFSSTVITRQPPTPNQHKRGGRKRPQHVDDALWMNNLRSDILGELRRRKTTHTTDR